MHAGVPGKVEHAGLARQGVDIDCSKVQALSQTASPSDLLCLRRGKATGHTSVVANVRVRF